MKKDTITIILKTIAMLLLITALVFGSQFLWGYVLCISVCGLVNNW